MYGPDERRAMPHFRNFNLIHIQRILFPSFMTLTFDPWTPVTSHLARRICKPTSNVDFSAAFLCTEMLTHTASVPRGIVPASRRCRITATSSVRRPTAAGRTASPAQLLADGLSVWLVRRSGIPCRTACGIRLFDYWREQFQTISEDVSVRNVLMHSAH